MIRLFLEIAIPTALTTLQFCQLIGPITTAGFSEGYFTWGNYRLNQFSLYASVTKLESRVSELKMFSQRNFLVGEFPATNNGLLAYKRTELSHTFITYTYTPEVLSQHDEG